MIEILVKRGERPSAARMRKRDRRLAGNEPHAGRGLRASTAAEGTTFDLVGSEDLPHPWRVTATLRDGSPAAVLVRVEASTVTYGQDVEEPILAEDPSGLVPRTADVALSDWTQRHMVGLEADRFMPATALPGSVEQIARGRKARSASLGLLADVKRPRGRRFALNLVPDPPRADLSGLDRGLVEFFQLSRVEPVLATWLELATVWIFPPVEETGAGWSVFVQQKVCWPVNFGLLPQADSSTEQPLVDPALRWFIGRYTQAPAATLDGYQANQQLALAYGLNAPPVAAWWT